MLLKITCVAAFFSDTAQKVKFSIKNFFSKCDQIRRKLDLVTLTEEILNRKLHFLCSGRSELPLFQLLFQEGLVTKSLLGKNF